jgi:Macrocin-O-methyltransferase (TylF)
MHRMTGAELEHDPRAGRTLTAIPPGEMRRKSGKLPVPNWRARIEKKLTIWLREGYQAASLPVTALFLFHNRRIHPSYGMTWVRKLRLAGRMYRNTRRIATQTSYKAHLAMAVKLLELAPTTEGVVVECGCWKGGSTANLSLICDIVGRNLVVYDSFEGLPAPEKNDKYATKASQGFYRGDLDEVRNTVRRYGANGRCQFRKGWFKDTLPKHEEPIALCFLDVDYEASMHDCIVNLWPHIIDRGYVFIDEYKRLDYCALFFSEQFWSQYFHTAPPGLLGTGTGIGVGQYFVGPQRDKPPIQASTSVAFTRKDFYGLWDYAPGQEHNRSSPVL